MNKEIGGIISLVFGVPLLARFMVWSLSSTISPSPESIGKGAELIADAAAPWWIGVMEWLVALPFAGLLILGFILFLKWSNQV